MNRQHVKRFALGIALLGATTLATVGSSSAARADGLGPTVQGIADSVSYGTIDVNGSGFNGHDPVTIQILDPESGATIASRSTSADRAGEVHYTFTFSVPSAVQTANQVTIRAVDNVTDEVTNNAVVLLSTPVTAITTVDFAL